MSYAEWLAGGQVAVTMNAQEAAEAIRGSLAERHALTARNVENNRRFFDAVLMDDDCMCGDFEAVGCRAHLAELAR